MGHSHPLHYYENKRIFKHNFYLLAVNITKYVRCLFLSFQALSHIVAKSDYYLRYVCLSFFLLFLRLALRMYQMDSQWRDYFQENCLLDTFTEMCRKMKRFVKVWTKISRASHEKHITFYCCQRHDVSVEALLTATVRRWRGNLCTVNCFHFPP